MHDFSTWLEKFNGIWQALAALGTWGAVWATLKAVRFAINLQRIYAERDRPVLSVALETSNKKCFSYINSDIVNSSDEAWEELWVRLLVSNSSDTPARDVQIQLVDIYRKDLNTKDPQSRSNLWFKISNLNRTSINLLPRDIESPIDIAYVKHEFNKVDTSKNDGVSFYLTIVEPELDKPWDQIKNKIENSSENLLIDDFTYFINIVVLSSNAGVVHKQMELKFVNPLKHPGNVKRFIQEEQLKAYVDISIK